MITLTVKFLVKILLLPVRIALSIARGVSKAFSGLAKEFKKTFDIKNDD